MTSRAHNRTHPQRLSRPSVLAVIALMLVLAAGIFLCPGTAFGQSAEAAVAADDDAPPTHAITRATEHEKAIYEAVKRTAERYKSSDVALSSRRTGFCDEVGTHYAPYLETCVWAWRFSGDTQWLDRFVSMMEALEAALTEDPEGRKGWHSEVEVRRWGVPWPPRWQAGLFTASQAAEARVGAAVAEFALATDKGEPDFRLKYSIPAMRWVRLFKEHLMPKWDDMGCFQTLSEDRGIYTYPPTAFGPLSRKWSPYPERPGDDNITLPHPYQGDIIRQYLKFWQLNGKKEYRQRAEMLLMWQKSCLRPGRRDSYWWHFFDPAGDHDFKAEGGLVFGMYMHPDAIHAARDVEVFVEAYHCGVVIDQQDLQRLINTQVRVMMAAGDDKSITEWRYPNGQPGRGMVWAALAEFNDRIESLVWTQMDGRNLEFGSPLRWLQEKPHWGGWQRRKLGDAAVIEWKKNYNDFKVEMEALLKAHPEPDPLGRGR